MIRNLVILASLTATCVFAQQPQKVTVCEIQKNPSAYQHRLVEVTAMLSQAFEHFRLFDPACDESFGIWIEYGGSTATGVVYCCGQHNGVASVDGIETPLVRDDRFRDLEQRLRRSNQARATVVGHFFAKPGDNGGYGHMGCCHLFVIERVLAVNAEMATLCEIKANPTAYHDKVIQVDATVNREFEDFSLFDPPCYEPYRIGLAFGGTLTIGRKRVTFPRVKDDRYRKLEKLVRGKGTRIRLNVTLVGRFVDRSSIYRPRFLFVIERVLAIDPHKTTDCEINRDTAVFDGKWIEVSAIVNRDLEEISLIDSTCFEPNRIKVAFGGTVMIGKQPVEFPRVRDDRYRELEKFVRTKEPRAQVDVTLVGRFRRLSTLSPPHLFVIERVLSVTPR